MGNICGGGGGGGGGADPCEAILSRGNLYSTGICGVFSFSETFDLSLGSEVGGGTTSISPFAGVQGAGPVTEFSLVVLVFPASIADSSELIITTLKVSSSISKSWLTSLVPAAFDTDSCFASSSSRRPSNVSHFWSG